MSEIEKIQYKGLTIQITVVDGETAYYNILEGDNVLEDSNKSGGYFPDKVLKTAKMRCDDLLEERWADSGGELVSQLLQSLRDILILSEIPKNLLAKDVLSPEKMNLFLGGYIMYLREKGYDLTTEDGSELVTEDNCLLLDKRLVDYVRTYDDYDYWENVLSSL